MESRWVNVIPKFVVNPSDIVKKNMELIHFVYMKCLWVH